MTSMYEDTLCTNRVCYFTFIQSRYEFPGNVDKMAQVHDKIEVVKSTMKENIQQLLLNEEKLERIETAAVQLNEQAGRFKEGSKELSNKMWWKMWKMRLLIGGLIVAVLIILIVPVAVSNSNNSK